jgi:hypothetical protein
MIVTIIILNKKATRMIITIIILKKIDTNSFKNNSYKIYNAS